MKAPFSQFSNADLDNLREKANAAIAHKRRKVKAKEKPSKNWQKRSDKRKRASSTSRQSKKLTLPIFVRRTCRMRLRVRLRHIKRRSLVLWHRE